MDESYRTDDMAGEMPIGVQDFKKIRKMEYFYVDKTNMISQILSDRAETYLYTRPRRFGKSLNLSMLDAFFNLRYSKDNNWFDGLHISGCPECMEHRNSYPVIYLDLRALKTIDYQTFLDSLHELMSKTYDRFGYLLDSDRITDRERKLVQSTIDEELNLSKLMDSILTLSELLCKYHDMKTIILIDEYDKPIHDAYGKEFHSDIIYIMKGLLSSALKGNESMAFGVVTGIMQVSKESIFSGLNNLEVDNIFSERYGEMFGFTDDEVLAICKMHDAPEKYAEAKEWYDGYRFGNTDVYNPWSIIKYVKSGFKPDTYWAGTSGNDILDNLLRYMTPGMLDEFRLLAERKPVQYDVNPMITFQDLDADVRNIYSMLVMSGYLTTRIDGGRRQVCIPNGEMARVFGDRILNKTHSGSSMYVRNLASAFIKGDTDEISANLYDLLESTSGIAMLNDEHSYQAFITGMLLFLDDKYQVKADFEGGNGRYDILLKCKHHGHPNIIIELKRVPSGSSDDVAVSYARKALEQIRDRDYAHGLVGDTLLYGIAFRNKKATVLCDKTSS